MRSHPLGFRRICAGLGKSSTDLVENGLGMNIEDRSVSLIDLGFAGNSKYCTFACNFQVDLLQATLS
jgi:hypothetical protein